MNKGNETSFASKTGQAYHANVLEIWEQCACNILPH